MRRASALLLFVMLGCGDDGAPAAAPGAMLAGPYSSAFPLTEETRTRLPRALDALADSDDARFYWYADEARGKSIVFEVRAETTVLEAGSVLHHIEEQVGEAQFQGFLSVGPRDLSRGGARSDNGSPRWLEGLYSVRIFVEDEELGTSLFEVR